MTSIAAVLPAFNAAAFITAALDSVRAQSRQPDEIIVVDDASKDDTVAVTEAWLATSGIPGRVIKLACNGGAAEARNAGIRAARTDFVAMLDADDLWLPEMVDRLANALEIEPHAVLSFGLREFFGAGSPAGEYQGAPRLSVNFGTLGSGASHVLSSEQAFLLNIESAVASCSAAIVKRQAAVDCGLFDPAFRTSQDREFMLRVSRRGGFVFVDMPVSLYRLHDSNTTHARNQVRSALNGVRVLEKTFRDRAHLALTAAEQNATREAMDRAARGLLYAAGTRGLSSYLDACRELYKTQARAPVWNPRSLLRACWYSMFDRERGEIPA